MKVRIKFAKQGCMKFIGHLDVMRYFQKAMRRAHIDIAFTEGYSPHMIMSFALPLGVGLTSSGEYLDVELRTPLDSQTALKRLNDVMVEGMQVLSFRQVAEGKAGKAMSLVAAADYTVWFRPGREPLSPAGKPFEGSWQHLIDEFLTQSRIFILKKTKTNEAETDIRPLIYDFYEENGCFRMLLGAGSAGNLKPELLMEAFASWAGFECQEHSLLVNREDLYAKAASKQEEAPQKPEFVSLESLGEDIVL